MTNSADPWLVLTAHSNTGVVTPAGPDEPGELRPIRFRRRVGRPLPGDRVLLDEADSAVEILPRKNHFGRGIWGGRFREMAANLDQVLVMVAPEPAPSRDLLHRYLAAAAILNIPSAILANKADLGLETLQEDLARFEALGYPVLRVSSASGQGIDALRDRLGGRLSLLAGQSGVGKTSMINILVPDRERQTARLSRVTGKGTHTTTTCEINRLADGGWLADSPGVWEYSLWAMDSFELEKGFPEIREVSAQCRFRDCRHRSEPGCAVLDAVNQGRIQDFRYQAWQRLLDEVERQGDDGR